MKYQEQEQALTEVIFKTLYWTWQPNGCRSSKRTDYLHKKFEELVLQPVAAQLHKNYDYDHEINVPTHEGKFKIDILARDENAHVIAFLLKLAGSSYNKNRFNYSNTEKGESLRFLSKDLQKRKVSSVNILPLQLPRFGKELKVETLNKYDIDYMYDMVKPAVAQRMQGDVLYFKIAEHILDSTTREELLKRLKAAGPKAITLVNYKAFMSGIEKIMA